MKIPFLDLITQHTQLENELVSVFRSALTTAGFIGGPMVEAFEKDFASFCRAGHCVGVGSGTDALRFALMAAGVGQGDVVVTVPNTFIATTEAISQAGALPEFVDIDERTCTMDPNKLEDLVRTRNSQPGARNRVRAVIPVHLYGQVADMDPIMELAERYNLVVVEDACQAHGAEYFSERAGQWLRAGSIGAAAAFSFYPGKNLGACGEAGAVTTNDEPMARTMRMLRDHGQSKKYFHDLEGYNGRLDAIQAGFLSVKMKYLDTWNEARREAAGRYDQLLRDVDGLSIPYEAPSSRSVYHLYVVRTAMREELRKALSEQHIDSGLHYPLPLHLQKAYEGMGHKAGDFPVTERVAAEILSLPMFPGITPEQQARVAETIRAAIGKQQ